MQTCGSDPLHLAYLVVKELPAARSSAPKPEQHQQHAYHSGEDHHQSRNVPDVGGSAETSRLELPAAVRAMI